MFVLGLGYLYHVQMVSSISTLKFLLDMATEFDQIPFGIYRLDHTAFLVNSVSYIDELLKMNSSGIPGINPVWSWGFTLRVQDLVPCNRKSPAIFLHLE